MPNEVSFASGERQPGSAGKWSTAIALAVSGLALALIFVRRQGDSYDAGIMAQVAESMVKNHNFIVHDDFFHFNSPYASYGIGMSLLMVPAFVIGPAIHLAPERLYAAVNAAVFAATLIVLYVLSSSLGANRRQAATATLLVGLGTPLLVYAASSFSELGTAFGVAVALLGVQLAKRRPLAGSVVAGAGGGIAVLMRPESLVLVLPITALAAWLRSEKRWTAAVGWVAGVLPMLLITAAYNFVRFGRPETFGYSGFTVFDHPVLAGVYGLLLSPARGLILYSPIVLVAAWGIPQLWRRDMVMAVTCVLLLVVRVAFFAPYFAWHGGTSWGPRFLVPALPALLPPMVEVVRRLGGWSRLAKGIVGAVAAISIGVQLVGASVAVESERLYADLGRQVHFAPDYSNFQAVYTSRATQDISDSFLFDYRYFPIADAATNLVRREHLNGRVPTGSASPIFVALVAISALGLLVALRPDRAPSPGRSR